MIKELNSTPPKRAETAKIMLEAEKIEILHGNVTVLQIFQFPHCRN